MKSIRDYIAQDMWGHILMSGPDIRGYILGEKYPTTQEQHQYCQGIFTMFPHMMLGNFTRWLWEAQPPKDYSVFMETSAQALQAKVFPVLEEAFAAEGEARVEKLIPLLTDVIPKHILTGFYDYMFAGQEGYQDISAFWPQVEPILSLTGRMIAMAPGVSREEQAEIFLYVGTRYPFLLLKRWYDWQYGEEKMELPPPPPAE